jgi:hypothetical protein
MTLYRKLEIASNGFVQLLAVSFLVLAPYSYQHRIVKQPDLGAFIDRQVEEYDSSKTKPYVKPEAKRANRLHFFEYSKNAPDDVFGELFEACYKNPKCRRG